MGRIIFRKLTLLDKGKEVGKELIRLLKVTRNFINSVIDKLLKENEVSG